MSVRRSVNWPQQLRVDTGDMRSIESAVRNDFDELLKGFVTGQGIDQDYVLRGFDIEIAGAVGNSATSLALKVADGAIFHGSSAVSGTFFLVPASQPVEVLNSLTNSKVSGSFTPNVTNYVSIDYARSPDTATSAPRALWDVVNKVEFSKILPLAETLNYTIVISTGAFAANTLPIATVKTDVANTVTEVTDRRPMLFRLGKAGLVSPNPTYSYPWTDGRSENPSTSTSNQDPFFGGDKQISNLKEWMDAVMTEIKLMKGSSYWYTNGSSLIPGVNLSDSFADGLASVMTGAGAFVHSVLSPGQLTWTSTVNIKNLMSNLNFEITNGSVTLANDQVAYVQFVRNNIFQPTNSFTFVNGNTLVQGSITVTGIVAGEWIKLEQDSVSAWAEVQSVSGSQITLTAPYSGTSFTGNAVKSTKTYTMQVADRDQVPNDANVYWIAYRDDSAVPAAIIESPANSGLTRTSNVATITTTAAHNRSIGEHIEISGASDASFDGLYEILDTPTPTTFTVINNGTDVGPGIAGNGTVSSSATIYIRGIGAIEQGESAEIGDNTVLNMLNYIGSPSESASNPTYAGPLRNITQGQSLTAAISSLDTELDKFFGQLQLKAQSPNSTKVEITGADYTMLNGTTISQEISNLLMSFEGAIIDFSTGVITEADGFTPLGVNFTPAVVPAGNWQWYSVSLVPSSLDAQGRLEVKCIVVAAPGSDISKNNAPRAAFGGTKKLGEVAVQSTGASVNPIPQTDIVQLGVGSGSGSGDGYIVVDLHDVYSTTLPSGPSPIIDTVSVVDGMKVLFTNLSSGNNQIYQASNTVTSVVWTAQNAFALGSTSPQNGALVEVLQGQSYANSLGIFRGTYWSFNDITRAFNITGDYYEITSPRKITLTPSTTDVIFSVPMAGSENMIIDYSIVRSTNKETGSIYLTHNGTVATATTQSTYIGGTGIGFTADINAGNVRLIYTADGSAGTPAMTYSVKRWADVAPGPGSSIPSYNISTVNPNGSSQTAFVMSDGSGTALNCSLPYNVLGKTRVDLAFPFVMGVLPGTTYSDIEVYVDGQFMPRFIPGVTLDDNFTEISTTTIEFDTDITIYPVSIEIRKRLYVGNITPVVNRQAAQYDAVVGNPAQVASNAATHSTIAAAITAAGSEGNILILKGTYIENVTINGTIHLEGQGVGTVIQGNITVNGSYSMIEKLKVIGNVTLSGTSASNYIANSWRNSGGSLSDTGTDNSVEMKVV